MSLAIVRSAVFLLIVAVVVLEFPGSKAVVRLPYSGIETQNLLVRNIDPMSPNASGGVQPNDEIVAVDGEQIRNYNHLRAVVQHNSGMLPQKYRLVRGSDVVEVIVHYTSVPAVTLYRRIAFLVVAFTFLAMALLVLSRRRDIVGVLFSLNCALIAFLLTDRPITSDAWSQLGGELFHDGVILFFPAVFLHFFSVFHGRAPSMIKPATWKNPLLLYLLPVGLFALTVFLAVRRFLLVPQGQTVLLLLQAVSAIYLAFYLVASMWVFVRNYRQSSRARKQKLRITIFGTVLGLLPFVGMIVWRQIATGARTPWEWVSVIALSLVSISFAYAILKHGVLETDIVVRKGLAYALLTAVAVAIYYGLVTIAGDFVEQTLQINSTLLSMITILVLALVLAPARAIVQNAINRLFLKQEYDYKHEVVEFTHHLSGKLKADEILDSLFERVQKLLGPEFVALYTSDNGRLRLELASIDSRSLPAAFPHESLLARHMRRFRQPLMVEYVDGVWRQRHLDDAASDFLSTTQTAVCAPLFSQENLFGLLVIGPKHSGRLYNRTDARLLERFCEHAGLILENARLHKASMEQERLKNEVLLARDIQLSLLPEKAPEHPDVKMHGRMESSEEVGGDYFDYFLVDDDRIGLCIGDVSGKGIPAAMLMSSIQAVFKNLASREKMSPGYVIDELDLFLKRNAKSGQFATFFYGILDLKQHVLTYANAGHCPPILLRAKYADRLSEGGMPLGVETNGEALEGRVRVESGDLLCLYTDGVTEQPNATDEEFGEGRLIDFLRVNKKRPLRELQDALFAGIRTFGEGVKSDDITCVIARHSDA